uniref:DUF223 domain-containing protein n=1 Tax=Leersia perrieri TaxID=77586 RepID=A0A0D9WVR2_9ORYZ
MLFDDASVRRLPRDPTLPAELLVGCLHYSSSQSYTSTTSTIKQEIELNDIERFNALLTQGHCYTIHRVRFQPNLEEAFEFRSISHHFECILRKDTTVQHYTVPIQFPPYPKHLMSFQDVYRRPNRTFVDIAGVVVHREILEHIGKVHYREFTLMDTRCNLLIVGVWGNHLNGHALDWSLAIANNAIVLGTMLKNNKEHGNVESSDNSSFYINPIHPQTLPLRNLRECVVKGAMDLTFVRRYIENRYAYLETDYTHSDYPITLPLRRPYSGDPEILNQRGVWRVFCQSPRWIGQTNHSCFSSRCLRLFHYQNRGAEGAEPASTSSKMMHPTRPSTLLGSKLTELPGGFMGKIHVYKSGGDDGQTNG